MTDPIVAFFSEKGTDHKGRGLDTILAFSDGEIEEVHDFIQWLFPLDQPSSFNPSAPLVRKETRAAFHMSPRLSVSLCRACARMLKFYGLCCDGKEAASEAIVPILDHPETRENWLRPGNHNHLRLTRMLRSLRLLGLAKCSGNLYSCLALLARTFPGRISGVTMTHWRESQDTDS